MYIQTSNKTADTLEVCISGEMDAANCAKHKDDFNDIIDGITVDRVEMNLEGISFLDSSGIGIIVFMFKRLKAQGREMVITRVCGQPMELMQLLRIDSAIDVGYIDDDAAVSAA